MELLPLKASFAPGEPIEIEARDGVEGVVELWHLDRCLDRVALRSGDDLIRLPTQAAGGYGVEAVAGSRRVARTAFDVLADPLERPRYGFVSRFEEGRDPAPVVEYARALHLNVVQFYDWMYRHAELLPPEDAFVDALGRRLSLHTVRALVSGIRAAGSVPLGYAAVYAVGREHWPHWRDAGLFRPNGKPWTLGEDFLWITDPSNPRWGEHLVGELNRAARELGFAGFHLDQYGSPKRALRADNSVVDLAQAFPELIATIRAGLPDARLIFNNVNAFPAWTTASAPQDALYVEVWAPNTRLAHLAALLQSARAYGWEKAAILAAYLSVYTQAAAEEASSAARLVMATIFSHGGFHLLTGEEGAVLTGAYYPEHHRLGQADVGMFRRWYDFAVRYGDLLYDPAAVDVTTTAVGGENEDVKVEAPVSVSTDPEEGSLWVRVVKTYHGDVVHLIDLANEEETIWDAPKAPPAARRGVRVWLRRTDRTPPSFCFAQPDRYPSLRALASSCRDDYDVVEIPPFQTWALLLIRNAAGRDAGSGLPATAPGSTRTP